MDCWIVHKSVYVVAYLFHGAEYGTHGLTEPLTLCLNLRARTSGVRTLTLGFTCRSQVSGGAVAHAGSHCIITVGPVGAADRHGVPPAVASGIRGIKWVVVDIGIRG